MKRSKLRIGHKVFGKTDFPASAEPWNMAAWIPRDTSAFEPPEDAALEERLSSAPFSRRASLRVHIDGFDATFRSWRQFRYFLWVFGSPNLPRGHRLTGREELGTAGNKHWLSRLPAPMKRWSFRRGVVAFLTGGDPLARRYIRWHLDQGATPPETLLQTS